MANYQNRTTEPKQGKEQPEKKLWKAVLNQVFQDAFDIVVIKEKKVRRNMLWII
jgi:hypothetical protein